MTQDRGDAARAARAGASLREVESASAVSSKAAIPIANVCVSYNVAQFPAMDAALHAAAGRPSNFSGAGFGRRDLGWTCHSEFEATRIVRALKRLGLSPIAQAIEGAAPESAVDAPSPLLDLNWLCPKCGTGHLPVPVSGNTARCRKCNALMEPRSALAQGGVTEGRDASCGSGSDAAASSTRSAEPMRHDNPDGVA